MTYDTILLRYGEIFLKGKNKSVFEHKLRENIAKIAAKNEVPAVKIRESRGRLLADYFPNHAVLRRVFGLVSYSPAVRVEKKLEEIQKKALELLQEKKGTFKVATKRSDKTFPIISPEFNRMIGGYIETKTSLLFSSSTPDTILEIEINQEGAYLFTETITCFGGLPTGVEGKALLLVEDEASLLAGLLFMKRGCSVIPVAFEKKDISLLQQFSPVDVRLQLINNIQELEDMTKKSNISILISGQNLNHKKEYNTDLLVMRPLIAYSDSKIKEELQRFRN
jgi:thiamine biosynthesis protein ThiI